MLQVFLIEQAEGGILQCEEEVIIGVEAVGIAGGSSRDRVPAGYRRSSTA
jgi:hypothetical protein